MVSFILPDVRRFILDAAHELRTPVAILQTRVETLASGPLRTRLLADTGRIAAMAETAIHLYLYVKVRENWSDDPARYREMGLDFPHEKR